MDSTGRTGRSDNAEWQRVSRRYYRGPGGWWWLALLLVPALLAFAAIGLDGNGDDTDNASTGGDKPAAAGAPSGFNWSAVPTASR